jgi:hypothetical protein
MEVFLDYKDNIDKNDSLYVMNCRRRIKKYPVINVSNQFLKGNFWY